MKFVRASQVAKKKNALPVICALGKALKQSHCLLQSRHCAECCQCGSTARSHFLIQYQRGRVGHARDPQYGRRRAALSAPSLPWHLTSLSKLYEPQAREGCAYRGGAS